MRLIATILVVVAAIIPAFGLPSSQSPDQSKCTLTLDKSPAVRGLRLGMTAEDVFALFVEGREAKRAVASAEGYPNYGVLRLSLQPAFSPLSARERFAGIELVSVTLFDGIATEIRVDYFGPNSHPTRGPAWTNVNDFISKLSEAFRLPGANDWFERNEGSKTLKCDQFEVIAEISAKTGSITIRGGSYQDTVRQRAAADEVRKRREFKP